MIQLMCALGMEIVLERTCVNVLLLHITQEIYVKLQFVMVFRLRLDSCAMLTALAPVLITVLASQVIRLINAISQFVSINLEMIRVRVRVMVIAPRLTLVFALRANGHPEIVQFLCVMVSRPRILGFVRIRMGFAIIIIIALALLDMLEFNVHRIRVMELEPGIC